MKDTQRYMSDVVRSQEVTDFNKDGRPGLSASSFKS